MRHTDHAPLPRGGMRPAAYAMLMEDRTQAGAVVLDWSD
jgi:hypothetical protein